MIEDADQNYTIAFLDAGVAWAGKASSVISVSDIPVVKRAPVRIPGSVIVKKAGVDNSAIKVFMFLFIYL